MVRIGLRNIFLISSNLAKQLTRVYRPLVCCRIHFMVFLLGCLMQYSG